jgi:hypothetical protein
MIMTAMRPPDKVTPHGERLLAILQSAGGKWLDRREIAQAIERKRLTPYDIAMLELLVKLGEAEAEQRPVPGPIAYEWIYRAVESKE